MDALPPDDARALFDARNPYVRAVERTLLRGQARPGPGAPAAERTAVAIGGAIVRGMLAPGQRLPEKEIGAALRASRATTREALRILERERLVEVQPRRGCVVASPGAGEVAQIFAVRRALHEILFTQLMGEDRSRLGALVGGRLASLDAAARGTADTYVVSSYLLNLEVVDLCGNRLVAGLLTSIALRTLRQVREGHAAQAQATARSLQGWHAIHRAVVLGDVRRVLAAVQARMDESRAAALAAVAPPRPCAARAA